MSKLFSRPGMKYIPGGEYDMGSNRFYPEESPVRRVSVAPFLMDEHPVTNAAFLKFVNDSGYLTLAERAPNADLYPGLLPEMAVAGSMVFEFPSDRATRSDSLSWWVYKPGARWNDPLGDGSGIGKLLDHPVVHIALEDAQAYAKWADKSLPTEEEWEFAARGGRQANDYAWGNELAPGGLMLANYWQGNFPFENLSLDGWLRTSPVGSFKSNDYGVFDLIGNVWEWTANEWRLPKDEIKAKKSCCSTQKADAARTAISHEQQIKSHVIKGGSHLCAPNYCQRYRPAARHEQEIDTSTSHIGFRCVVRNVAE